MHPVILVALSCNMLRQWWNIHSIRLQRQRKARKQEVLNPVSMCKGWTSFVPRSSMLRGVRRRHSLPSTVLLRGNVRGMSEVRWMEFTKDLSWLTNVLQYANRSLQCTYDQRGWLPRSMPLHRFWRCVPVHRRCRRFSSFGISCFPTGPILIFCVSVLNCWWWRTHSWQAPGMNWTLGINPQLLLCWWIHSPTKLLRSFPPLQAKTIIELTLNWVRKIPSDVYDELVHHAQWALWNAVMVGLVESMDLWYARKGFRRQEIRGYLEVSQHTVLLIWMYWLIASSLMKHKIWFDLPRHFGIVHVYPHVGPCPSPTIYSVHSTCRKLFASFLG